MIIRVTLKNGVVVVLGDSYKRWETEFQEYCWFGAHLQTDFYIKNIQIDKVEYCEEPFPAFGGMKWGSEADMVQRLQEQALYQKKTVKPYSEYVYLPATPEMLKTVNNCIMEGWRLAYANGVNEVTDNA